MGVACSYSSAPGFWPSLDFGIYGTIIIVIIIIIIIIINIIIVIIIIIVVVIIITIIFFPSLKNDEKYQNYEKLA